MSTQVNTCLLILSAYRQPESAPPHHVPGRLHRVRHLPLPLIQGLLVEQLALPVTQRSRAHVAHEAPKQLQPLYLAKEPQYE